MNKNNIIITLLWIAILSVTVYNIGIVQMVLSALILFVASALYIGVP